ncbi:MAG: hypothetical protein J6A49_09460 [Clostridia bacterium]|nr:hypothetical protein [Clostridia bacterium]
MNTVHISFKNASTTNNGIFEGWGTSLCWWAHRIGYSDVLTEKSADIFFGESGLNLNIMRYNIGGGDDPTHAHIKRTDSKVPGWLKYDKDKDEFIYDYNADRNQLNVLKAAYKKAGKDAFVEVFSNSPPYFMTKSGCSSGNFNPNENNLKEECYKDFAEYIADVTEYINNVLNIKVSSVSPMNEPNTDYWKHFSEKQEGCHYDCGESQNRIILETAKAIKNKGLNHIQIVASDETSTDKQLEEYLNYTDEVKAVIDRVSTHTYGTEKIAELGKLMKEEKRNLWMSETDWSDTTGKNAGEMGAALWLAKKIIFDINNLSPSAWVIWLTIDHHKSKDGYLGNKDSGFPSTKKGYWGLAFAEHDKKEIVITKKYYAMGQFSKFIRPGDTIIHCNDNTLAAFNSKTNEVKIVCVNCSAKELPITVDLTDFKKSNRNVKVIRTSGNLENGENWAVLNDLELTDNTFSTDLKGNSVTTFIVE